MCKDKKVGRKHELSLQLASLALILYSPKDKKTISMLAEILANHDIATLEELKERLKN